MSLDPNGSLLLTQTSTVLRLTPPAGGFGGTVPEPSSVILLGTIAGLIGYKLRGKFAKG